MHVQACVFFTRTNAKLACQQVYKDTEPYWRDSFWTAFGLDALDDSIKDDDEKLCTHLVQHCMTPFGVVASDTSNLSDQGAAMVVDGRVQMVRNYWAVFVEDEDTDDPVSMQNERLVQVRAAEQAAAAAAAGRAAPPPPVPPALNRRKRKGAGGGGGSLANLQGVGHEHGDKVVMPQPGEGVHFFYCMLLDANSMHICDWPLACVCVCVSRRRADPHTGKVCGQGA